jgi:CRP-like cAMP-binding protein
MVQLYDQLLCYSLFLGMSHADLMQLVGNTRFQFSRFDPQKVILQDGDLCHSLLFLMKGEIQVQSFSDDRSYSVLENLAAPWMIEPESLFGLSPRYAKNYRTLTECHFLILSKDEVLKLFDNFLTFRLNYLNLLATAGQQRGRRSWRKPPQSLEQRISRFFIDHCIYPAGTKEFRILMKQLAAIVNDSRLDVSAVLNDMQQKNLIELSRGRIVIPSLERLFM